MTRIIEDIEAHYETREVPFGRIYILNRLYNAQTKERIDVVRTAANGWLTSHPHDEAVRLASDQAKRRRLGSPL